MGHQLLPMDAGRHAVAVARATSLAFASPPDGVREWMANAGHEQFRVLTDGQDVLASLVRIPMGQYFGGTSVPLLGIAGVAVAPEHRGRGHAKAMMRQAMIDEAAEGWALAGLYASTHSLYRGVGFEHAGHRFQYSVPIVRIDTRDAPGSVVSIGDDAMDRVRACYATFASTHNGPLDRGAYIWNRIRKHRENTYDGFAVVGPTGAFDGYLFLTQTRRPDGRHDLLLSDLAFNTAAAGKRLWSLLADFAPMAEELTFFGGPTHPALELLQQQRFRVELKDNWLIRVLDVKRALEGRGYSTACRGEVHLDVRDDIISANQGRFVLRVEGGRGSVRAGGDGAFRCTIRGLAAMYSGLLSPPQARLLGYVEATDADCVHAGGLLAASTPWMSDMY